MPSVHLPLACLEENKFPDTLLNCVHTKIASMHSSVHLYMKSELLSLNFC